MGPVPCALKMLNAHVHFQDQPPKLELYHIAKKKPHDTKQRRPRRKNDSRIFTNYPTHEVIRNTNKMFATPEEMPLLHLERKAAAAAVIKSKEQGVVEDK